MIAFVVMCLISAPATCERHELVLNATETQCLAISQVVLAQHIRPGFAVRRFGCRRME